MEIATRWHNAINKRLTVDKITATKIKRTATAEQRVRQTWEKALKIDGDLPDLWLQKKEVLVGRRRGF